MKDLLLKKASLNKESIKVEERPKETFTLTELVKETELTLNECSCLLKQLISEGTVETVTYVVSVTSCGSAVTSTVYREKVATKETSTSKSAVASKK